MGKRGFFIPAMQTWWSPWLLKLKKKKVVSFVILLSGLMQLDRENIKTGIYRSFADFGVPQMSTQLGLKRE